MASIESLIQDARGFAAESFSAATSLVENAVGTISGIDSTFFISGGKTPSDPALTPIDKFVPDFNIPEIDLPPEPGDAPDLLNLPSIDTLALPINTAVNPGFIDPAKPAPLHALDFTAPMIRTNFTFPDAPALLSTTPVLPTISDRPVPVRPEISIPNFDGVRPTDTIEAPGDYGAQYVKAYRDIAPTMVSALDAQMDTYLSRYNPQYKEQMAAMEDKIAQYVRGGTALAPAVENALYERGRDKNNAEARRTISDAFTSAAKRGMTLPDGTAYNAAQMARQMAADNNSRVNSDIVIKQAELEQQNVQFAITTSGNLRTAVMQAAISYHGNLVQINGQALSYAQAILSAAIEVYNAYVRAFEAKLQAYQVDASVYSTRVQAALSLVEIYKAEISALEALTRVDVAKIEIYKSQIDALGVLANVYRTRVETVQAQAQIERLKIDIFGAQVQAYATEAQAKNAEWQGYSAAVNGQEARLRAYGTEISAYSAQVDAYRSSIQAKQAEVQSITSYNTGLIAQYTAGVDAYRARVGASAQVASSNVEFQKTKLIAFQARVGAQEANARIIQERYRTAAQIQIQNFQAVATTAIESAKVRTAQVEAVASTSIAGARVYEGLASAALNGMNTLVTQTGEAPA